MAQPLVSRVANEWITFREIAEVIGRPLNVPVAAKSPDEATDHFGWLCFVVAADNPTSKTLTQQRLDWHPAQPGLIADLEEPY
ncbi:MAG: nucleoside-diphosphate sugar epimerase [Gemmatimonadaceae bacterium]